MHSHQKQQNQCEFDTQDAKSKSDWRKAIVCVLMSLSGFLMLILKKCTRVLVDRLPRFRVMAAGGEQSKMFDL